MSTHQLRNDPKIRNLSCYEHSWQSIIKGQFIYLTYPCHSNSFLRHHEECLSPWCCPFDLFLPSNSVLSVLPFVNSPWLSSTHSTNMCLDKRLPSSRYQMSSQSERNSLATHCTIAVEVYSATATVYGCLVMIVKQTLRNILHFLVLGRKSALWGYLKLYNYSITLYVPSFVLQMYQYVKTRMHSGGRGGWVKFRF